MLIAREIIDTMNAKTATTLATSPMSAVTSDNAAAPIRQTAIATTTDTKNRPDRRGEGSERIFCVPFDEITVVFALLITAATLTPTWHVLIDNAHLISFG